VDFLSDVEGRVLGALIEKDITTPDYYPLSLNALLNACNQKNNRDPVMALGEDAVRAALDSLQRQRVAGPARGADSRVTKYEHHLQEVFNFDRREIAILCVLLLRGAHPELLLPLATEIAKNERTVALLVLEESGQLVFAQHPAAGKDLGAVLKSVLAAHPGKGGGNKDFVRAKLAEPGSSAGALEMAKSLVSA